MGKRLLILSDRIGVPNEKLGRVLMHNFLYSVARNDERPVALMFMNEGVRLVCEGSDCLDDLRILASDGVALKACGTCLDYLGLMDQVAVGEVGTMPDAAAALLGESDVVTIT